MPPASVAHVITVCYLSDTASADVFDNIDAVLLGGFHPGGFHPRGTLRGKATRHAGNDLSSSGHTGGGMSHCLQATRSATDQISVLLLNVRKMRACRGLFKDLCPVLVRRDRPTGPAAHRALGASPRAPSGFPELSQQIDAVARLPSDGASTLASMWPASATTNCDNMRARTHTQTHTHTRIHTTC